MCMFRHMLASRTTSMGCSLTPATVLRWRLPTKVAILLHWCHAHGHSQHHYCATGMLHHRGPSGRPPLCCEIRASFLGEPPTLCGSQCVRMFAALEVETEGNTGLHSSTVKILWGKE